tara:strand:- start:81 stop:629 length:549 start_codon:yes stop_codon:yes gene_type:complete
MSQETAEVAGVKTQPADDKGVKTPSETELAQNVTKVDGKEPSVKYVPRSRLNEEIDKVDDLQSKVEEYERAKLEAEGKITEVNAKLKQENAELKQTKKLYDELDNAVREEALSLLSEDKREKFKGLKTSDLKNVVEELVSVRNNPPDDIGAVTSKFKGQDWTKMDDKERRSNWSDIVNSFKR